MHKKGGRKRFSPSPDPLPEPPRGSEEGVFLDDEYSTSHGLGSTPSGRLVVPSPGN